VKRIFSRIIQGNAKLLSTFSHKFHQKKRFPMQQFDEMLHKEFYHKNFFLNALHKKLDCRAPTSSLRA